MFVPRETHPSHRNFYRFAEIALNSQEVNAIAVSLVKEIYSLTIFLHPSSPFVKLSAKAIRF